MTERRDQGNTTSPVTKYEGKGDSPFGVVDMAGNVWEWTNSANEKPLLPDIENTTIHRVLRGGPWHDSNPANYRSSYRLGYNLDARGSGIGFRCVRSLK